MRRTHEKAVPPRARDSLELPSPENPDYLFASSLPLPVRLARFFFLFLRGEFAFLWGTNDGKSLKKSTYELLSLLRPNMAIVRRCLGTSMLPPVPEGSLLTGRAEVFQAQVY